MPSAVEIHCTEPVGCVKSPLGLQEWAQLSTGRKEVGELQLSLELLQARHGPMVTGWPGMAAHLLWL